MMIITQIIENKLKIQKIRVYNKDNKKYNKINFEINNKLNDKRSNFILRN